MEFTPEMSKKWNSVIIDCFKVFKDICEKHGLTYFCVGGTAIGCVRHKGMIPWDDDIDVAMPRSDYDRFIKIYKEAIPEGYELITADTPYYPVPFLKFCNANTTLVEKADVPCVYGLFIDIFPIDGMGSDRDEAIRRFYRYKRLRNKMDAALSRLSFSEYLSLAFKPKEWGRMATQTLAVLIGRERTRRMIIRKLEKMEREYSFEESEYIAIYAGSYFEKEIMPKEWFLSSVDIEFEGMKVKISSYYHEYLSQLFGDYMQLPPEEKRVSHHLHAFVDMEKRTEYKP